MVPRQIAAADSPVVAYDRRQINQRCGIGYGRCRLYSSVLISRYRGLESFKLDGLGRINSGSLDATIQRIDARRKRAVRFSNDEVVAAAERGIEVR